MNKDDIDIDDVYVLEDESTDMVMFASGDFLEAVYSHPTFLELVEEKTKEKQNE